MWQRSLLIALVILLSAGCAGWRSDRAYHSRVHSWLQERVAPSTVLEKESDEWNALLARLEMKATGAADHDRDVVADEVRILRKNGSARLNAIATFTRQMRSGDELWRYKSPPEGWAHLCGESGLAIVRQGQVVKVMCLLIT